MSNQNDCCTNPYGYTILAPILLTLIATALNWVAIFACGFFEVSGHFDGEERTIQIGLTRAQDWNMDPLYADSSNCTNYAKHSYFTTDDLDAPMQSARGFGIFASATSTIVLGILVLLWCREKTIDSRGMKLLAILMLILSVTSILILMAFASDLCNDADECMFRAGGVMAIAAFILWIVAASSLCFLKASHPRPETMKVDDADAPYSETEVKETHNADGTVTKETITTAVNADGSKDVCVTKEIQPAAPVMIAQAEVMLEAEAAPPAKNPEFNPTPDVWSPPVYTPKNV